MNVSRQKATRWRGHGDSGGDSGDGDSGGGSGGNAKRARKRIESANCRFMSNRNLALSLNAADCSRKLESEQRRRNFGRRSFLRDSFKFAPNRSFFTEKTRSRKTKPAKENTLSARAYENISSSSPPPPPPRLMVSFRHVQATSLIGRPKKLATGRRVGKSATASVNHEEANESETRERWRRRRKKVACGEHAAAAQTSCLVHCWAHSGGDGDGPHACARARMRTMSECVRIRARSLEMSGRLRVDEAAAALQEAPRLRSLADASAATATAAVAVAAAVTSARERKVGERRAKTKSPRRVTTRHSLAAHVKRA